MGKFTSLLEEDLELVPSLCQLEWENKCHFLVKEIEICFIKKDDRQMIFSKLNSIMQIDPSMIHRG